MVRDFEPFDELFTGSGSKVHGTNGFRIRIQREQDVAPRRPLSETLLQETKPDSRSMDEILRGEDPDAWMNLDRYLTSSKRKDKI